MTEHAGHFPCAGCDSLNRASPSDVLCVGCWKRLPADLPTLYRTIWRMVHAKLVPSAQLAAFDDVCVAAARAAQVASSPRRA